MDKQEKEQEFSFKSLFVPLTTFKAIHWIVIVGLIVYGNMLFNSFVADDITLVIQNPSIHTIANLPILLFQSFINTSGAGLFTGTYYVPISLIVLSLIYSLFGANPFFFHFVQLSLHIANASLIYLLFSRFFSKKLAFFLSLVFLVHPITQETVAYIADMQDVLFLFFGLLAFYLYVKSQNKPITPIRYVLISTLLFFSLLSKITGGFFLIILSYWIFVTERKKIIMFGLLCSGILLIYFILKAFSINVVFGLQVPQIGRVDMFVRMITIPKIIFYYISTFFFPMTLITHQDWIVKAINIQDFYIPILLELLFFIIVGVFGYYIYRNAKKTFKIYLLFCLWFIIGFLLHIQIIPLDFTVADRWFYFPLVGLLGLSGLVIQHLRIPQKIVLSIGISILLVLSIRTIVRNENWRTEYSLYSHDLNLAQDNAYLNGLLGNALLEQGQYDASIVYFNKALQLNPTISINYLNLSAAYFMKGDLKKTEIYLIDAISKDHSQMAYERLSTLYLKNNNFLQAKKVLEQGIKYFPKDQKLYLYLAYSEYNLNNRNRALILAQKAYELLPSVESQYILDQITNNQKIIFQ